MENLVSNCCGANPWLNNPDLERCGDCLENCEFEDLTQEPSERFLTQTLAVKLFLKHNVRERGLGAARREMMQTGVKPSDRDRVCAVMLGWCTGA
jgi:hypothetical protein